MGACAAAASSSAMGRSSSIPSRRCRRDRSWWPARRPWYRSASPARLQMAEGLRFDEPKSNLAESRRCTFRSADVPDPGCVPRLVEPRLAEALEDAPVVLLHGPRQSGKSTAVSSLGQTHGRTYLSFDDDVVREAASSDPVGFVLDPPARVTLDEIKRVPQRFTTLEAAVDRERAPAGSLDRRLTGGGRSGARSGWD